ncbi:MAG: HlyD family efflux transporter periplasmic adaptor subunit [Planctomycetales bacterium]
MWLWIRRFLMLCAGLGFLAALGYAFLPQAIPVELSTVKRGSLRVTVDEDGKTRIKDRYVVSAPLSGRLQRITLKAGDKVEAGKTVLGVIEPTDPALLDPRALAQAEARVKAAEAAVKQSATREEQSRAEFEHADAEHQRMQKLQERKTVTQKDLDDAVMMLRTSSQAVRSARFLGQVAQFELESAKAALIHTRPSKEDSPREWQYEIRSPINGKVLRVLQESTAVVNAGTQLLEIGDPDNLEIVVDVLSQDGVKIRPGSRMLLEQWGGEQPLEARVRLVEPSAFTKISALGVEEQRVNVIADFVDPPEKRRTLGDGFRVEAKVIIWESPDVLTVPTNALFRIGSDWGVYTTGNGEAHLLKVDIGHRNALQAEVLAGLNENQRVVIYPSDKLRDKAKVLPQPASSAQH